MNEEENMTEKTTTPPVESGASDTDKGTPDEADAPLITGEEGRRAAEDLMGKIRGTGKTPVPKDTEDGGLADFLAKHPMKGQFALVEGLGWLMYDKSQGIFRRVSPGVMKGIVSEFLIMTAEWMVLDAPADLRSQAYKNTKHLRSAKVAGNVLSLLGSKMEVAIEKFDQHPTLLCCGNGVVDSGTKKLMPFDAKYRLTKRTPVRYIKDAKHPLWTKILSAINDKETEDWLQRRMGQTATGRRDPNDQIVFLYGGGENGKTQFMTACTRALGRDYFPMISKRLLLDTRTAESGPEVMRLRGARGAFAEEMPDRRLSIDGLKLLAGQATIQGRHHRQESTEFDATHTAWATTNWILMVLETDHATWRRLKMVHFPIQYVKTEAEVNEEEFRVLGDPAVVEAAAFDEGVHEAALAWIVDGASKPMPRTPPAKVEEMTQRWRDEADELVGFIKQSLDFCKECATPDSDLRSVANAYLTGLGLKALGSRTFTERFGGHREVASKGVKKFQPSDDFPMFPDWLQRITLAEAIEDFGGRPRMWRGVVLRDAEQEIDVAEEREWRSELM